MKAELKTLCFVIFCSTVLASRNDELPKRYRIDLNKPPNQRWNQVLQDFSGSIPLVIQETKFVCIAEHTGLPLGEIVGVNILYDITDFDRKWLDSEDRQARIPLLGCTSIVAENEKGEIIHGRNLDYDMTDLVRNITIIGDFVRDDQVLFSTTTFVLMVGALTGQRPNAFSISLNARYSGGYWDNIFMELFTRFHNPVSFEIRKVLETVTNYDTALAELSNVHFVAPSYIILGGVKSGEGAIITRNRWASADVYALNAKKSRWFVLETNFDRLKKTDDPRRKMGKKFMREVGQSRISAETMYAVLSKTPLLNNLTIFTTVMSAANPELFYNFTMIRRI
ncbi:linear amide c-N hydrolase, choloylglycine hydrolase family domain-containing protein [Ditylenchus destructor]|nr:linear amide c-N hydrolase, choloylglycine hydrolase family domain-containing protein [Ditylenchus destructor]